MSNKENPLSTDQTLAGCGCCGQLFTPIERERCHLFHDEDCQKLHGSETCTCSVTVHDTCCSGCGIETEDGDPLEPHRITRCAAFYPAPEVLAAIPPLYGTEKTPLTEAIIHLHYFIAAGPSPWSHWWLTEYDPEQRVAFGYVCLHGDHSNAEWGYCSLPELAELYIPGDDIMAALRAGASSVRLHTIVERDLAWTPRPVKEVALPGWSKPDLSK